MTKLPVSLVAATLALLLIAVFASAQTAAKPSPQPTATPAPAAAPAAPPKTCERCPPCSAAGQTDAAENKGGMMQGGMMQGGMMQGGMMQGGMTKSDQHARLHEVANLADVKVQTTKFGAVIQLSAKKPEDVTKVQDLARDVSGYLTNAPEHAHPQHAQMGH